MPLAAWASPLSAMIGGMDIAVIGSNMVDLIAYIDRMPAEGETVRTPDFQMGCGGKGANQAVAASRLGAVVLMVTRVGNDLFADNTIANFEAHGIDTTHVLRTEATSGVAPIFVDPQSRNSIIIIPGANDHLSPADIDAAADDIARCRLIVLQLEVPANAELDFARIASVDWFVPNETELALLTGLPVDSLDEVDAAASALLARGMTNVLVTLGARGVAWYSEAGRVLTDAETVDAVDTTGSGDAFIGCFAHSLVSGLAVEDALVRANAYAADSVTHRGTQASYADAASFGR